MIELNFPNAVRDEKDFFNRKRDLERMEQTFLSDSARPVVILGERRIGKTSLQNVGIRRLVAGGETRFVPLFLHHPAIHSLNDYAEEMLKSFCSCLGRSMEDTGLVDARGAFRFASFGRFTDAVAKLLKGAGGGTPVTFIVCVDEFDNILYNCGDEDAKKIIGLTDHLVDISELPLTMCITLTRMPALLMGRYKSPLLATESEVIELGPFSRVDMEEMVGGLLGERAASDGEGMSLLFRLSGGHPYFVKLLLEHLLRRRWSEENPVPVTADMIEEITPDAVVDFRPSSALANIYRVHFDRHEQKLVLMLTGRGEGATREELKALGAPFLKAARKLERRGYLEWSTTYEGKEGAEAEEKKSTCNFRIGFFPLWLKCWEEYEEEMHTLEKAGGELL